MAAGIYTLPICDGCKLPWLPVGWTQDSDPRNPEKPLRCGKCKSIGWDREFVKQQKESVVVLEGVAALGLSTEPLSPVAITEVPAVKKSRCKHRMTDCPICHTKEAA